MTDTTFVRSRSGEWKDEGRRVGGGKGRTNEQDRLSDKTSSLTQWTVVLRGLDGGVLT